MNRSSPVYEIKRENRKNDAVRVLHRNLLLPCNDLPVDNSLPSCVEQPTRKSKGHRKRRSPEKDGSLNDQETDSSSEDDEIALLPYELPCNQREIVEVLR